MLNVGVKGFFEMQPCFAFRFAGLGNFCKFRRFAEDASSAYGSHIPASSNRELPLAVFLPGKGVGELKVGIRIRVVGH